MKEVFASVDSQYSEWTVSGFGFALVRALMSKSDETHISSPDHFPVEEMKFYVKSYYYMRTSVTSENEIIWLVFIFWMIQVLPDYLDELEMSHLPILCVMLLSVFFNRIWFNSIIMDLQVCQLALLPNKLSQQLCYFLVTQLCLNLLQHHGQ